MTLKRLALGAGLTLALSILSACGGGGGGGGHHGGGGGGVSSDDIIRFPYETVYGDACRSTSEPTPGCTFVRSTGLRVTVSADPHYNREGFGSDDVWYVTFQYNSSGQLVGVVKDDLGNIQRYADPSEFAGYLGTTHKGYYTIGVGQTGAYWEDVGTSGRDEFGNVIGGSYWFGKNGVLYSANTNASNYGQAINNKKAGQKTNTNSKAIKSASNVALIKAGAAKLQQLGLSASKATAVASAMNSMAVMSVERGAITEADYNRAFKTMTGGIEYRDALAAFASYTKGDKKPARELSNRSAAALGLSPEEGERYVKGLYKSQLSKWGYDVDQISLKD